MKTPAMNTYHILALFCLFLIAYAVFTGRGDDFSGENWTIPILLLLGEIRYYTNKKFDRQEIEEGKDGS